MTATQLIEQLQKLIAEHGDLELITNIETIDGSYGAEVEAAAYDKYDSVIQLHHS